MKRQKFTAKWTVVRKSDGDIISGDGVTRGYDDKSAAERAKTHREALDAKMVEQGWIKQAPEYDVVYQMVR